MSEILDRIQDFLRGLQPRERLLAGTAAGIALLLIVIFGGVQPLLGAQRNATQRAEASASELQAVRALREQFDQVNGRLLTVEERIHDAPQGEIFSTLEQLASQSQVSVDSMEPRSAPARDDYSETKVQVTLKGQTLSQVVRYLHGVESAPQPLSIKSLRIRTRADKPELLDVTFTVSSFEPIEG